MNAKNKIGWVLCVAMVAASATAYFLTPRVMLADTLPALNIQTGFPDKVGEWNLDTRAELSIPNPETEGVIKSIYTDVLSRVYYSPSGKQIFLSVAYGKNQSDGHALHYPEICYPAQGFTISDKRLSTVSIGNRIIPAKRMVAARGSQIEPVTYWATVGEYIILNGTAHKIAQLRYGFKGLIPDGLIIRVSSIGQNPEQEYDIQREFLESLINSLSPDVRYRVLGNMNNPAK